MKIITSVLTAVCSAILIYLWETNSRFIYGHFIDILAGITIIGMIAILVAFHCRFKKFDGKFDSLERSSVRGSTMMFCNLLLDKEHIKSADISYLYKLEEDCKKLGINGYVQSNIEQAKNKYLAQEGESR